MHELVQREEVARSVDAEAPILVVVAPDWIGRNAWRAAAKRAIDVVGAAIALVVLAPLLAAIALLVVIESPGPVFYRDDRLGFRGKPLSMLKFRKMHPRAQGTGLTLVGDKRLTRVGAWLAHSKLDELPQLWHVLRGDMSLVGPRPESPGFVACFPVDYAVILGVRPGLTGFSQLAFAREGAILDPKDAHKHYVSALLPQKVGLDRMYAGHLGTRRDIRILLATFGTLVLRRPVAINRKTGALTARRRPTG
jgi:lipopolysaccharide/colanic/teichoic acid biosynthesis glycosyltransferase